MGSRAEQTSGCCRYFSKGAWRRLKRDAKRAVRRKRRREEKRNADCGSRFTRGWAD